MVCSLEKRVPGQANHPLRSGVRSWTGRVSDRARGIKGNGAAREGSSKRYYGHRKTTTANDWEEEEPQLNVVSYDEGGWGGWHSCIHSDERHHMRVMTVLLGSLCCMCKCPPSHDGVDRMKTSPGMSSLKRTLQHKGMAQFAFECTGSLHCNHIV